MGKLFNAYVSAYRMDTKEWNDFLEVAGDIYNSPQLQKLEGFVQHFNISLSYSSLPSFFPPALFQCCWPMLIDFPIFK